MTATPNRPFLGRLPLPLASLCAALAVSWPMFASAQAPPEAPAAPEGRAWNLERSLGVNLTFSDNARLSDADKQKDIFGQASGSLRLLGQFGAVRGAVDYALTGIAFAKQSDLNDVTQFLRAAGTAEIVPQFFFVDAAANIGQQPISLQDVQTSDRSRIGATGTQVRTFSLSPQVRGTLGASVNYDGRFTWADSRASGASIFNTQDTRAAVRVNGGGSRLGWFVEGSLQNTDGAVGIDNESRLVDIGLTTDLTQAVKLGVFVGRDWNNFTDDSLRASNTGGFRLTWLPQEPTAVTANYRHRKIGNEHQLAISHRTATMVWALSDTGSTSTGSNKGASSTTLYDIYSQQFLGQEADPVRRDALVRDFLNTQGLNPSTPVVGGFLGAGVTRDRTLAASVAWVGPRSTASLRYATTRSRLIRTRAVAINDDFDAATVIRQRGLTIDMSHRLTPVSSVTVVGEYRRTAGDNNPFSDFKAVTAAWTGLIGPRSDLSAGVRYAVSSSPTTPYKEWSAFGGYRVRF